MEWTDVLRQEEYAEYWWIDAMERWYFLGQYSSIPLKHQQYILAHRA